MTNVFDFKELDKIIHSPVRLGIMSALVSEKEVDFKFLKDKLDLSDGNLSANMTKLEDAGFVHINKFIKDKKTRTLYKITNKGREALRRYVDNLEKIIKGI